MNVFIKKVHDNPGGTGPSQPLSWNSIPSNIVLSDA